MRDARGFGVVCGCALVSTERTFSVTRDAKAESKKGRDDVTTRWICLDGPDGGGHSTHADALAAALAARGIDAVSWHHPVHPAGAVGLARVCHYERSRMWTRWLDLAEAPHAVYVLDRGPWSGLVHARALEAQDTRRLDSGHSVAAAELALWWDDLPVALLDASDATLDARLLLRGEDPRESHHERAQWRRLAASERWPVVDTSGPREAVGAALLAWALRVLA
jgi:thymidylate kinase